MKLPNVKRLSLKLAHEKKLSLRKYIYDVMLVFHIEIFLISIIMFIFKYRN